MKPPERPPGRGPAPAPGVKAKAPPQPEGFVPLRRDGPFQPANIPSGGAPNSVVVPIRGGADMPLKPLPNHGKVVVEAPKPPPPPPGPSAREISAMVAAAEERGRKLAQGEVEVARKALEEQRLRTLKIAEEIDKQRASWAAEVRGQVGGAVVGALERLMAGSRVLRAEVLKARLAELSEHLVRAQQVLLHVHPADLELATRLVGDRAGWRVIADPAVSGGCLAELDAGELDATLASALRALTEAVEAWGAEQGAEPRS